MLASGGRRNQSSSNHPAGPSMQLAFSPLSRSLLHDTATHHTTHCRARERDKCVCVAPTTITNQPMSSRGETVMPGVLGPGCLVFSPPSLQTGRGRSQHVFDGQRRAVSSWPHDARRESAFQSVKRCDAWARGRRCVAGGQAGTWRQGAARHQASRRGSNEAANDLFNGGAGAVHPYQSSRAGRVLTWPRRTKG